MLKELMFALILVSASDARKSYSGYRVHRFEIKTESEAAILQQLQESGKYDFWTEPIMGRTCDVMTSPETEEALLKLTRGQGLSHSVMIQDVEELAALNSKIKSNPKEASGSGHPMDWTDYHDLADIYAYFDYLETTYDFVSTESIGRSYEGQDMRVVKICKGGCDNKPAMWIDGGIHAREWISPATVTWMLHEVVENDADHPHITENLDWYFLASHNPDGYRYSIDEDRLWRKTRTQHEEQMSYHCYGTDANRNFDYHWAESGSSDYGCSETYHGPTAFSEIEAVNVRDFVAAHKDNIKFFNTVHSYSQLILIPWGYTSLPTDNNDMMMDLGFRGNDALYDVHGKVYEVGCIPCVLYTAAGTSLDWAYGVAGIPYVYSIELRDTGDYGFLLPPNQIIPTAEETWAFHLVAAEQMISEFGK